jgi:NADPH:quinone reductase-like Zn-dependent oxidoreductase
MKAVLLEGYGGVDQLRYEDVPTPAPGEGEVLIRMISTSINPVDYKIREGAMKEEMPMKFPVVLGYDIAGEVTALGPGVDNLRVGDKAMGVVSHSYAEYLTARAADLCRIPDGLDPQDAGVLPLVLQTGTQLIETGVQPKSGEVVLVTGAGGNVGRTAVYVAKLHGARAIAGVRAKHKAGAQSLGAESVVAIDDDAEIAALPELDAIADTVNGETVGKLIPRLKKSGRLASVVGKSAAAEKAGIDVRFVWSTPDPKRLFELAKDVRDGKLKIPIAKRFALREIREAHRAAQSGLEGKIALIP